MTNQFYCKNKDRWKAVVENNTINGIDYLEVAPDQLHLKLFFLLDLPDGMGGGIPAGAPELKKENIFIEGGVRVKDIKVTDAVINPSNKKCLDIIVSSFGDYSIYTLKIGQSSTSKDIPPHGFDLQLSHIDFSFKINCPNDFDCKTEDECPPATADEPSIDYLAKDFSSFKKLMLDRLSIIMPDWKERHAADLQVALIELLAYVGDHLSYYQDAVATEAYLHTARRRISLKRHARLLDYHVHDGCNARVWVQIQVDADGIEIKKGTALMASGVSDVIMIASKDKEDFIFEKSAVVFETMHDIRPRKAHNLISFYTWGDTDCCLPKGATQATLVDLDFNSSPPAMPFSPPLPLSLHIQKGDVLVFEELYNPDSGVKSDADPAHRHVVRIKSVETGFDPLTDTSFVNVEWYDEDAMPFALCLTSPADNEYMEGDEYKEKIGSKVKSVVRGNIVLADHGETVTVTPKKPENYLSPVSSVEGEVYYPTLPEFDNTVAVMYDEDVETGASLITKQDPHKALPAVSLSHNQETWTPQKDLLSSDRFATEFVVETEQNGKSYLRFGDDILGKKPDSGFSPDVTYRTGNGRSGNVGAEAIDVIEWNSPGIIQVRNPLPASGGTDPETMEEIRQFAPQAFRVQERAVTAADYIEKTELHPEVQKAAARFYWTGSWYTVYIIIDRKAGLAVDEEFKEAIRLHLEQYRMAGYDLEIRQPEFVPLQIVMKVCVTDGYYKSEVRKSLIKAFSNGVQANGRQGFFHPDNFSFGQPLYISAMYKVAMELDGVSSVELTTFNRWAKENESLTNLKNGYIQPAELEILRLDNDPNFPENGKIDFIMLGGL